MEIVFNTVLCVCYDSGKARCPPQNVLDQLEQFNNNIKIGQMLCRSRDPDFLLDVIERQVSSLSVAGNFCWT